MSAPREQDRLGFVLHLGDFIYEIVWYPEDRPQGMYDRRMRDIVRYAHGEKIEDFHVPTTVDDYRAVYRGYLHDPDLQDARARWPFVCMWDNHEFSWLGWQALQKFDGENRPAQTQKVAANQAFFEYQPARISKSGGPSLEQLRSAARQRCADHAIRRSRPRPGAEQPHGDRQPHGLSRAALGTQRRSDHHGPAQLSIRGADRRAEAKAFSSTTSRVHPGRGDGNPGCGTRLQQRKPPASIRFGGTTSPISARTADADDSGRRAEGVVSRATAALEGDLEDLGQHRRHARHARRSAASSRRIDRSRGRAPATRALAAATTAARIMERSEIYDFMRAHGITGFATVAGDRHSFWAGLAGKALPPKTFEPVGSPLSPDRSPRPDWSKPSNIAFRKIIRCDRSSSAKDPRTKAAAHGQYVAAAWSEVCLEYAKVGDLAKARAVSESGFIAASFFRGYGRAWLRGGHVSSTTLETEFVCIPRPLERSESADGGPLVYRVKHKAKLWKKGQTPKLEQQIVEGDPRFSI